VLAANLAPLVGALKDSPVPWIDIKSGNRDEALDALEKGLRTTLVRLAPMKVVVFLQSPLLTHSAPGCIARRGLEACAVSRIETDILTRDVDAVIRTVAAEFANVSVLDPKELLCTETFCAAGAAGSSWYIDTVHLRASTVLQLTRRLAAMLPALKDYTDAATY
jgi:hypothetical protein